MSGISGPNLVTSGLVFAADSANMKSYDENLLTYSQAFTGWTLQNITATSLSNTAPDGDAGATLFTTTSSGYTPVYNQPITVVAGSTLTLSVYFRVGSSTTLSLVVGNGGLTNNFQVTISNLTTTPTLVGAIAGTATYTSSSITAVGNGWYRVSVTGIIDSSTTAARVDFPIATSLAIGSSIYLWGAQLNYGNAAAPYTPTTATAVAKTLNDMSGNGYNSTSANITYNSSGSGSLLFNGTDNFIQCSGSITVTAATFITWMRRNGSQVSYAGILYSRGTNITGISFFGTTNKISYTWNSAGETYNWDSGLTIPDLTWCMIAVSVTGTTATAYLCQSSGITSAANPAGYNHTSTILDDIKIGQDDAGSRFFNGIISSAMIYNRALSATEVAQNFAATKIRYGL
jgi:hypothetical protein